MYFINLSTIIRIESNLFFVVEFSDLSNFVIKSIIIESYSFTGILINLIYSYDKYLATLFYWQIIQLLIYTVTYSLNLEKA